MALPGSGGALGCGDCSAVAAEEEDASKKVRKPYTITKSRESWSEQEHDKFLEALQLFDRDWKKIEAFVGSKTVIQIRSHAQKYFLKVQKNGTSEHVPPPRPKRKAAHPYPQKATKNAAQLPQAATPQVPCMVEPGYAFTADTASMIRNSSATVGVPSRLQSSVQPVDASNLYKGDDVGLNLEAMMVNNCCSSSADSPSRTCWSTCETMDQDNNFASIYVVPDFAQVYGFLGSVFDPNTTGHLERLKEMDPLEVDTVLLLMKNLSINLTSPDFEAHRKLLSTYDGGGMEAGKHGGCNVFQSSEPKRTSFTVKGE